jgi:Reeler domain-containing protein
VAFALAPALAALATSSGPQPGETGVPAGGGFPAEPTCTSCHTGFPLNSDGHGVLTLAGVPARYVPGQRYTLTVSLRHPDAGRSRWGFQLTAISAKTYKGAGEFLITDQPNTQLIQGVMADRSYVSHSYYGSGVGELGGRQWSFDWVAPAAATGKVEFFGAGSAADSDGSQQGDRIYSPSPKPLAITSPGKPGKKGKP